MGNPPGGRFPAMLPIVLYVLAIVACSVFGALAGWAVAGAIGLTGTPMALVAAFVAMVVATGAWILGTTLFFRRP